MNFVLILFGPETHFMQSQYILREEHSKKKKKYTKVMSTTVEL